MTDTAAKHRVLFVEDDPDLRALVPLAFHEEDDVDCETAICGLDAWDKYQRAAVEGRRYRLIVTDISMPDLTGISLARRIRESGDNKTIIVFFTGNDGVVNHIEAEDLNVAAYLLKPAATKEIRTTICALLGGCERRETERRESERRASERRHTIPPIPLVGA